jgi:phosphoglycerate dehydrogenase-like enzyme
MTAAAPARIALGPDDVDPDTVAAVKEAGGAIVGLADAEALVWTVSDPAGFPADLPDDVRWVQLPSAGVESWLARGLIDTRRTWTSATGAYARPVAEHAVALLLAGLRQLPAALAADTWRKPELMPATRTLAGSRVGIYGAGSIARAMIPVLTALGAQTVAVNRTGRPVPGAVTTMPAAEAGGFWRSVDHVVLAAPATSETRHLVGEAELEQMREHAWLVNVARGSLVDTDALRPALDAGRIAGVALDVTDPEPLPEGHWLFGHPRAIVTPHIANPASTLAQGLRDRIFENVSRFARGKDLVGIVDLDSGY